MYNLFRLFSALMKVHPIRHAIFETTRSGFIQILHHCSVSWKITPLYLFSSNLIYFGQKEHIKVKCSDFWVDGWKFTKLLISCLKPQVSFSLNFASLLSVTRDNSFVLFQLKLYMIWTKEVHQSARFETFDCSRELSPNLYFDRLLLLKVYKISAKNVHRSYVSWHWRVMQNLREKRFVDSKMTRIWWILIRVLKILKNVHFNWSLSWKVYNV